MNKLLYLYLHNNQVLNDAFDRIAVELRLRKERDNYKTFLLSGCEPGVGTTSVAINLAISMALSGSKTILVDGDMRKISQYKRLHDESAIGLAEYLTIHAPMEEIICQTNYNKLNYVPCGITSKNSISILCSEKMDKLIKELEENYDCIIFDFPSTNAAVDANIIASKIDATILIASQGTTSKRQINEAKKKMKRSNANILGIIVNKVEQSEYKQEVENFDYFKDKKYVSTSKKGNMERNNIVKKIRNKIAF